VGAKLGQRAKKLVNRIWLADDSNVVFRGKGSGHTDAIDPLVIRKNYVDHDATWFAIRLPMPSPALTRLIPHSAALSL
jgi:hypothetical protein